MWLHSSVQFLFRLNFYNKTVFQFVLTINKVCFHVQISCIHFVCGFASICVEVAFICVAFFALRSRAPCRKREVMVFVPFEEGSSELEMRMHFSYWAPFSELKFTCQKWRLCLPLWSPPSIKLPLYRPIPPPQNPNIIIQNKRIFVHQMM